MAGVNISAGSEWSSTDLPITTCKYVWIINQFDLAIKYMQEMKMKRLTSGTFVHQKKRWNLQLSNYRDSQVDQHLNLLDDFDKPYFVRDKLYLLNNEDVPTFVCEGYHRFQGKTFVCRSNYIDISDLLDRKKAYIRKDGSLAMGCEIAIIDEPVVSNSITVPAPNMTHDVSKLLQSQQGSDVTLIVKGENDNHIKFAVHSIILSMRSPVFAAMFTHETAESRNNEIIIEDADSGTIRQMLQYIYTDHVEEPIRARTLLSCADKYGLDRLKIICERELCKIMDVDNAADMYRLAYLHNSNAVKDLAWEYIQRNVQEVIKSGGWSRLRLVSELPDRI